MSRDATGRESGRGRTILAVRPRGPSGRAIPRWRFDVVLDRFRLWRLAAMGSLPTRAGLCGTTSVWGPGGGAALGGDGNGRARRSSSAFWGTCSSRDFDRFGAHCRGAHRGGRARILGGFAGRNQGRRSVEQGPPEGHSTQLQAERRQIAELVTSLVPAHRRAESSDCLSFRSCFSALVLCGCGSSSRVTCAPRSNLYRAVGMSRHARALSKKCHTIKENLHLPVGRA